MAENDLVEKGRYELTTFGDVKRFTQRSRYFSVIDLKETFNSIEMEEDKCKTAFEFNKKAYEWNSMIIGYKNSPHTLQRGMDTIFEEFRGKDIETYINDMVIYSESRGVMIN
ncbi:Retrovirus-related Pol polyprotein from transposon [Nosema granulosis]|uniref:Retrovirus-related Pol polyprotein from transposon n=1 Tax=Nosema granulosis TaxID=83296 RepID=A0A9P6KYE4_9MICR|nr:Retrovirus-related Pol polyprotein from transposon [Nosema granulosis]